MMEFDDIDYISIDCIIVDRVLCLLLYSTWYDLPYMNCEC